MAIYGMCIFSLYCKILKAVLSVNFQDHSGVSAMRYYLMKTSQQPHFCIIFIQIKEVRLVNCLKSSWDFSLSESDFRNMIFLKLAMISFYNGETNISFGYQKSFVDELGLLLNLKDCLVFNRQEERREGDNMSKDSMFNGLV